MSDSFSVRVNDDGVTFTNPNGAQQFVSWAGLNQVSFVTTDQGPFEQDVFLLLEGDTGNCLIGQDTEGYETVLERVTKLNGFNFEAMIAAMSSTENAKFLCWKKS